MERESVEEDYPLVLDAPFSNVDEEHVVNISSVLPKVTGQLILIVMEKDWKYAAKELTYRVGKKYTLNKHTELDRKSTRLNSSHVSISYAVFCLKKKNR